MSPAAWAYLLFTAALAGAFAGIVWYYFGAGRRDRVEAPKYRMLCEEGSEGKPEGGR